MRTLPLLFLKNVLSYLIFTSCSSLPYPPFLPPSFSFSLSPILLSMNINLVTNKNQAANGHKQKNDAGAATLPIYLFSLLVLFIFLIHSLFVHIFIVIFIVCIHSFKSFVYTLFSI